MFKYYGKVIAKHGISPGPLPQNQVGFLVKRTVLTAAQIKTLYSTAITLVAAPGAGKAIVVDKIVAKLTYATAVFTGSNNLEFRYTNASGDKVLLDGGYAFLNGAADAFAEIVKDDANVTPAINAAVVVVVPSANPGGTGAASTLTLDVYYKIVS
jgi:hypothetical protein